MELGNCFESSFIAMTNLNLLIGKAAELMKNVKLVHGEVTGTGGDTLGIRYCHGWVEFEMNNGSKFCFDPETGFMVVKSTFYTVGSVTYVREYTIKEAREMVCRFEHYGPWEERLLKPEMNINPTFGHAKKGVHYE